MSPKPAFKVAPKNVRRAKEERDRSEMLERERAEARRREAEGVSTERERGRGRGRGGMRGGRGKGVKRDPRLMASAPLGASFASKCDEIFTWGCQDML
jgi:hypothetical protein